MAGGISVDCLVVGAGPAGSVAAHEVARNGYDVLMVEKRGEIGVPVRCGEGISKDVLDLLCLEPDPSWALWKLGGARIFSPGGHSIVIEESMAGPEVGYVIRREEFDKVLARRAAGAGAVIQLWTEATELTVAEGGMRVIVEKFGRTQEIDARVVVAADGFESQVARWGGIDTRLPPGDVETCIQYEMVGLELDTRYADFYLGRDIAPGGYVWIFPKADDAANVGIGVNGIFLKRGGEPKELLDRFIEGNPRFKGASITEINAGGVSVSLPLERTVADHMVVTGDAARMIDPLTGGGIYNACLSGLKAGEAISKALEKGDTSERGLSPYEGLWRGSIEEKLARNYIAKEKFLSVDDRTLDRIVDAISDYNLSDISTRELLKVVMSAHPELLPALGGLL